MRPPLRPSFRVEASLAALAFALALTGCDGGVRCDYTATAAGMVWSGCADGVVREITCDPVTCHCRQNGASVRPFAFRSWPWSDRVAATRMANDACGWNLSRGPLPF